MTLFLLVFSFISFFQNSQTYYEDEKVKISYTSSLCELKNFNSRNEYYIIEVENKTKETLVINFHKGIREVENQEHKVAFVLNPSEVQTGGCINDMLGLRVLNRNLNKPTTKNSTPFNLSNIQVIEVY